jgi:hypothetical protein
MPKLNGMPVAQLAPTNNFLRAIIKTPVADWAIRRFGKPPAGWLVVTCGKDETCPSCKGWGGGHCWHRHCSSSSFLPLSVSLPLRLVTSSRLFMLASWGVCGWLLMVMGENSESGEDQFGELLGLLFPGVCSSRWSLEKEAWSTRVCEWGHWCCHGDVEWWRCDRPRRPAGRTKLRRSRLFFFFWWKSANASTSFSLFFFLGSESTFANLR